MQYLVQQGHVIGIIVSFSETEREGIESAVASHRVLAHGVLGVHVAEVRIAGRGASCC